MSGLSAEDKAALRQAFLGDGRSTVAYALADGRTERVAAVVERIVAEHVTRALNEAADRLAAFNCEVDIVPRHIDVPDDYESGINDAAYIVRSFAKQSP